MAFVEGVEAREEDSDESSVPYYDVQDDLVAGDVEDLDLEDPFDNIVVGVLLTLSDQHEYPLSTVVKGEHLDVFLRRLLLVLDLLSDRHEV